MHCHPFPLQYNPTLPKPTWYFVFLVYPFPEWSYIQYGICWVTFKRGAISENNCRSLILASAKTCLICQDCVTSERNEGTRRLRQNVNYVKVTTTYVTMTGTELFAAPESWTQCIFSNILCISLYYFSTLDATSKVMYRHEIISTGNMD